MKKLITYLLIVCLSVGLSPFLSNPQQAAAGGVGGGAFGAQVGVSIDPPILPDITITLPPVAPVTLPVGGGGPFTNTVVSASAGVIGFPVLSTGVITDTTAGVVTPGGSDAMSSSTVNGLNVLSSLVSADTLVATANSTCNGITASSSGSLVATNLVVGGGTAINGSVAPNTVIGATITLPVIGSVAATVTLNEQITTGDGVLTSGITVNAVHVRANGSVVLGDYSVDVIVASASSSVICMANTPPSITPATPGTITRQQGSPGTVSTIATVSDPEDPAGSLVVTTDGPLPPGITVTGITNTNGTITATVAADCSAAAGPNNVTLKVTDTDGTMTTTTLVITVTANTPPTVGVYPNSSVTAGQSTTVTPSPVATDNGNITTVSATTVPAFTGTLAGSTANGAITVTNAGPPGVYTINVVLTDNCNATTNASFQLTVGNNTPTITPVPSGDIVRQQGSPGTISTIATVSDPDQAPGTLVVTVQSAPPGITVTGITNTNGTITATVAAGCAAATGPNTVVLQVADSNGGTSTANLTVNVTANTAPTVGAYPNSSVTAGGSTTVTPAAAPADNGNIASVTATTVPAFTGTLSGNTTTGVITVTNAAPPGVYTINVVVTDECGATANASFQLTVGNNTPTITPVPSGDIVRQQGSPGTISTIATVSDPDQAPGTLVVTVQSAPPGITVTGITNTNGTITATVAAGCAAATGPNTVVLQVADSNGGTSTANLTVNVTANTAPTVGAYPNSSVTAGGSTTVTPAPTATDNGNIASVTATTVPAFTGTLSGNTGTGAIVISNAAPPGVYTINVVLTDNCGATTNASFQLTVGNNTPTITPVPSGDIVRQQGSPGTISTIATVSDPDQTPGTLVVTVQSAPPGITVTGITNTNGTITATVAAGCAAATGPNTVVLQVADSNGGTSTANLTVNVTANTAPTVGTYPNSSVAAGQSTTVTPAAAPADNGNIASVTATTVPAFTGTLSGNTGTGAITVTNAGPVGIYTINVVITDNCGATTNASFQLTVGNNTPTITPVPSGDIVRQQGSPGTISTIATVSDPDQTPGTLVVTVQSAPPGITVTGITNTNGTITATVAAGCAAATGPNTVVLQVADSNGGTSTANLTVNVTANSAPTVGAYPNSSVAAGQSTTVTPAAAPADNGNIASVTATTVPAFTGTLSGNTGTGAITVTNAGPVGIYTINVVITDNCGATTNASFQLTVNNNGPSITPVPSGDIVRQQGSPGTISTIATVSDPDQTPGTLVVTVMSAPPGITVTGITNTNGTITANVAAGCAAAVGANTVVLQVADSNGGTSTANLTVNVTANTAPTVGAYPNSSVAAGGSTTVTPAAAPADNGNIASVTATTVPAFTGTLSGNTGTGAITVTNAGPVGIYTINVVVTDNCGATATGSFQLTVNNNGPTITTPPAGTISRQQGSPGTISTIATVSDPDQAPGTLVVTVQSAPPGITVTGITNTNGTVTATVAAGCAAALGANTVVLQVADSNGGTSTANLTVNVTANTAPTVGTYPNASVAAGQSTTVTPAAAPADNGSIASVTATTVPAFTGTLSGNTGTGAITVTNAAPPGVYTINVVVTDNCGATATGSFQLTVNNNGPTITTPPAGTISRQQGSPGTISTIATVSDPDQAPGTLVVTVASAPPGITVTGITNTNGTVTATVAAGCTAAVGANTVILQVADTDGSTSTANLTVNVTANTAPTVGAYANTSVALGGSTTVTPAAAPADNGSIASVTASTVPAFTGTLSGNTGTGAITITNAAPPGSYTINVVVTDNCGATTTASFILNVACPTITVNPPTLINGLTFIPYSATLSATGGSGSHTFSLAAGTLPAGLTLSGNTISGTPNTAGASTFTIRATDATGCFGERSYTLLIGSTGLMYYPLARPIRLLDTRPGFSPDACFLPNTPIPGGTVRTQPVRGVCKGLTIPPEAISVTGNITSVQSGGGFLAIYPSDAPAPLVSNSNFMPNEIINNAFTVGLGADGAVKISVTTTTDVVVDLTGYYAAPSQTGLYFHTLPRPVRLLETRVGYSGCFAPAAPLQGGVDTLQQGTGSCQGLTIPPEAKALVGNATTVNPVDLGYLTLYPANAARPLIASSNYNAGQTVNGPFTVGLSPSGQFKIFPQWTTDLVIDITGYYSSQVNDANGPGLLYSSLGAPLRLLDTRPGFQGCYTPGAPMTGGTVYTQDTQSPCTNLTPTARALIGNATVVNTTAEGYLTFWPGDAAQPLVATSNYVAGQVINRYFTVGLGPDGSFKRFAYRTTDLVVDISGFFAP